MDDQTRTELEAAAFRRLVGHLRERTDVQNIDMMNLAGFCRNCLSRWYREEAEQPACRSPTRRRARSSTACPMPNGRRNIRRRPLPSKKPPSPLPTAAALSGSGAAAAGLPCAAGAGRYRRDRRGGRGTRKGDHADIGRIAGERLKSFIERIERLEEGKAHARRGHQGSLRRGQGHRLRHQDHAAADPHPQTRPGRARRRGKPARRLQARARHAPRRRSASAAGAGCGIAPAALALAATPRRAQWQAPDAGARPRAARRPRHRSRRSGRQTGPASCCGGRIRNRRLRARP